MPIDSARRNIQSALRRGLPELQPQGPQLMPLMIMAPGPSGARARRSTPAVMAVNGALKIFAAQGGAPSFWAGCDAGPALAACIPDEPPAQTTYFVASRCAPQVFDALAGRNVVVWHLAEPAVADLLMGRFVVPTATTVTLCAMWLGYAMGFRRIETWGWDGCYMADAPYSIAQAPTGSRHKVSIGSPEGPSFDTTGTWLDEAREARAVLDEAPFSVKIHGGGMFAAILKHNKVASVEAA